MNAHPELISSASAIEELAKTLRKSPVIGFDTEFIRETTFFPVVEIIQFSNETDSWLVDAKAGRDALAPLLEVFEDKNVLKVVHAAQGDQECLFTSFGVVATPSLDTAVAASLCGYGDGIGLSNLLKSDLGVTIKKGHARTNWSVRPLPAQLVEYAHVDVEYLVPLAKSLFEKLERLDRKQWALDLSAKWEDKALYQSDPAALAQKLAKSGRLDKKGYAALIELVKWRETRVRQLNLPRRWVADDNVLVDLAQVRPKDLGHLSTFRGLNKGELKNSGEAILSALARASEQKNVELPRSDRSEIPSTHEGQVLDLLKCYIGILADEHQIAAKHLMSSAHYLPLLRARHNVPDDLVKLGFLTQGAAQLIGQELIDFIDGKRALSVNGLHVKIVKVDQS